jgi:asparagine synthase (glutamine-hydrolysing)
MSQPGLSLYLLPGPSKCYAAHPLGERGGQVLGLLFDRQNAQRSSVGAERFFSADETREIEASRGRYLVERYWGRYVAFLCDANTSGIWVLRDPIGDIRCYAARLPGISIYFSSLADFLQLKAARLTVNWEHMRLRVITGNAWAEESALNEIECVHAGECIEHRGTQISRQYYWHPFTVARLPQIEPLENAAAQLRSTTRACLDAWASLYPNAVHLLSGGLDSSIVLGALAAAPAKMTVTCLNFRTRDMDSDERRYARLATARAGCELVELERKPSVALEQIFQCDPSVGPTSLVMRGLEVQPLVVQCAESRQAPVVFAGDGGDIVFFRGWPQLAVIDYAQCRGLHRPLMQLALGASGPTQLSVWQLLYDAVVYGALRRPWDIRNLMFEHYRLVTDEVIASARSGPDFLNPWGLPDVELPPGKRLHAFSLSRPLLFRDPFSSHNTLDFINPLISQPLVELCLRIPTYVHAAGGTDRAVARAAFASDLPPEILARTWKGAADRHLQDMLDTHLGLVREVLLDGALVRAGILDRRRLEHALAATPVRSRSHPTEVFGYFCTEAWLSRWEAGAT